MVTYVYKTKQKEAMSALWSRGSVNLFTCVIFHKSTTKTLIFCTNYKGKDKFANGIFLENLYADDISPDSEVETEVIWSDGPTSEFKVFNIIGIQ